ncbi:hypothetical protein HYPGJ_31439 [Hyphomicrobium sp. GJ21]|nr:hypothetical protein HYPGJ_31439 [Hyphomicrobium sp. GJ21]
MARALVFDNDNRVTRRVDDDEIRALAVDRAVGAVGVVVPLAALQLEELAVAGLGHHTVAAIEEADSFFKGQQHLELTPVEKGPSLELHPGDKTQLLLWISDLVRAAAAEKRPQQNYAHRHSKGEQQPHHRISVHGSPRIPKHHPWQTNSAARWRERRRGRAAEPGA